jgi:hypothetical protein
MVPVAPIITGITFVFTFHMRCISIVRLLLLLFTVWDVTRDEGNKTRLRNVAGFLFTLKVATEMVERYCTLNHGWVLGNFMSNEVAPIVLYQLDVTGI